MGHHFAEMGHHSVQMGHKMGHHFAEMGHKRTPMDTKMVSRVVMVKFKTGRGVSTRLSGTERPKNQVRAAKADPTSFCDFRRLWYTSTDKL